MKVCVFCFLLFSFFFQSFSIEAAARTGSTSCEGRAIKAFEEIAYPVFEAALFAALSQLGKDEDGTGLDKGKWLSASLFTALGTWGESFLIGMVAYLGVLRTVKFCCFRAKLSTPLQFLERILSQEVCAIALFPCVLEVAARCDSTLAYCISPTEEAGVGVSSSECDEHFWPVLPATVLVAGATSNAIRAGTRAFVRKCGSRVSSCFRRMTGCCRRSVNNPSLGEAFDPDGEEA